AAGRSAAHGKQHPQPALRQTHPAGLVDLRHHHLWWSGGSCQPTVVASADFPAADQYADDHAAAKRHAITNRYADANGYAHADGYAYPYRDGNRDADAFTDDYAFVDGHGFADADPYADADTHPHADGYADDYTDTDDYADAVSVVPSLCAFAGCERARWPIYHCRTCGTHPAGYSGRSGCPANRQSGWPLVVSGERQPRHDGFGARLGGGGCRHHR